MKPLFMGLHDEIQTDVIVGKGKSMESLFVTKGVYYVRVPEYHLTFLCGCPPDVVKYLMRHGLISEVTQDGVVYETGPNAILLSDLPIQNGKFANLAEFPILQMFYRQGMIIPGHPNNTGVKPLIVGHSRGLIALEEYLLRGTYGLSDVKEVMATGTDEAFANEVVREKLWFAFGKIRRSDELLELCPLDSVQIEVRPGFFISRLGVNVFKFKTEDQTLIIDLNLKPNEIYISPIRLGYARIKKQYFSVIHLGEGDGWDVNRPCMASLLQFQGKLYLIDAGPNILDSLSALGIGINEIEGIFQSHAHDDHFAGLPSLARTDHRMKYYSTRLIRTSVMKKMSALMSVSERSFSYTFDFHDLEFDQWNNVEGLSVMPVWSPHPVETNIFMFRAAWQGGSKSYVHLADIASFSVLKKLLVLDKGATEYSKAIYKKFTKTILEKADLKKIDIGGGMIHGEANDFQKDLSSKIVLAHISRELTSQEKEIGTEAAFGIHDVLIPAYQDFRLQQARNFLRSYFPEAFDWELDLLLNCKIVERSMGTILQRKGEMFESVFLIVGGIAEAVDSSNGHEVLLTAGTLIGEFHVLTGQSAHMTWRAKSYISVLEIPMEVFIFFAKRNTDIEELKRVSRQSLFLQSLWLFGESVSSIILMELVRETQSIEIQPGTTLDKVVDFSKSILFMVEEGTMSLSFEEREFEIVEQGGFCGEESLFLHGSGNMTITAKEKTRGILLPGKNLREIPIVEWKILEVYERRLAALANRHRVN